MSSSSKPGWRRERGRRQESTEGRGWQSRKARPGEAAVAGHRIKLTVLGLLAISLVVAFVLAVILWPRATPFLVVGIGDYASPFPPNRFVQEDVERLTATNSSNLLLAPSFPTTSSSKKLLEYLETHLERARPGGPDKDVVLLYLSAHGVLDSAGQPRLLLGDAQPLHEESWLKTQDVLDVLKRFPHVRKVLLLDATRLDDQWGLGVLYNGFTEQLEKQLQAAQVPRMYVLNATSPGERGWDAPELGGSVFGHFVVQGLHGEASRNDRTITMRELAAFVADHVAKYVHTQRAGRQTPRLLTPVSREEDFPVAYAAGGVAAPPPLPSDRQQIASRWQPIHDRWRELESLMEKRDLLRHDPLAVAEIQRELLRAEQLLLAGKRYSDELQATVDRVRVRLEAAAQRRLPSDLVGFSLPLHSQMGTDAADETYRDTLVRWQKDDGKPVLKKDEPPPAPLTYHVASQVAWRFMREHQRPRWSQLRDVMELVDGSLGRRNMRNEPLPDVVEILFLRMLQQHLDYPTGAADFSEAQRTSLVEALAARELAEQAAAPHDERVHYWIQRQVNEADQQRRLAEDQLFHDASAKTDSQGMGAPRAAYQAALDQADELARIYALRDEVWSGLPYLSGWLFRAVYSEAARGNSAREDLLRGTSMLAESNHRLAAALDESLTADRPNALNNISPIRDEVQSGWERLRRDYVTYCQQLRDRGSQDKPTLREIGEVLRVPSPLLAADERQVLATTYLTGLFMTSEVGASSSAPTVPLNTGESASAVPLPLVEPKALHPAAQLVDRASFALLAHRHERLATLARQDEGDLSWLCRQGGWIRQRLADVESTAQSLEDDTKDQLKRTSDKAADIRAGVSEADRLVRAAATLLPAAGTDSAKRLHDVDRHLQMLWLARRTLDDFWGPAPSKASSSAASTPYFAAVTNAYLEAARKFDDTPISPTHEGRNLRDLLTARLAAIQGTKLEPQDVRTLGDRPFADQQVRVSWHADLPTPGTAALFLERSTPGNEAELIGARDADGRDWRRQVLRVGEPSSLDLSHQVPTDPLLKSTSDQELRANLLYRGNRLRTPFALRSPERELVTTVAPRMPPQAKVMVRGEGARKAYVTIMLDCSASMNESDASGPRMSRAKESLQAVLRALDTDGNYYVGLRAFAHRFRYQTDAAGNLSRNESGKAAVLGPDGKVSDGNPDQDMQVVVPIDKFDVAQRQTIQESVQRLQPRGNTPLYWSLQRTLLDDFDFAGAGDDDLKHIIVISDGINENVIDQTSVDDVLAVLETRRETRGKRIDVVMFQEAQLLRNQQLLRRKSPQEIQASLAEIERLAAKTGGRKHTAENPDELVETMRQLLDMVKFSASPPGVTEVAESERLELGQRKVMALEPDRPQPIQVQIHGGQGTPPKRIVLEGGEAAKLEYDKTRNELIFPQYQPGDKRVEHQDVVDPTTQERYRVIALLPEKSLNRVDFLVAVQNTDVTKFTRRPPHVWAEITPLDAQEKPMGQTHVFYDAQFLTDTEVPVFQFVVNDWRADVPAAAIRMWFAFEDVPIQPNGSRDVQSLERVKIQEDIPQVEFEADIRQIGDGTEGWRLTVAEVHDSPGSLFTVRVQSTPPADRVSHRYYVGLGEARHVFDYATRPAPKVVITSRERLLERAVAVPRLVVQVRE